MNKRKNRHNSILKPKNFDSYNCDCYSSAAQPKEVEMKFKRNENSHVETSLYCESPALGIGAPKCSEDCPQYGGCSKKQYFDYIEEKYGTNPERVDVIGNFKFEKVVVDGREYGEAEIIEILKKHKEEEDKKYHKCERCGKLYLQNDTHNLVKLNFDKKPDNCSAWGYAVTPYIRGFRMLSTCGDGREVELCDDCIKELQQWLTAAFTVVKHGYWTGRLSIDDAHSEGFASQMTEEQKELIREHNKHLTHCSVCGASFDDRDIREWKGCPHCLSIIDLERPEDAYIRGCEYYGRRDVK